MSHTLRELVSRIKGVRSIMPDLNGTILEAMSRSEASRLIEALIEYMRYIGKQELMDR